MSVDGPSPQSRRQQQVKITAAAAAFIAGFLLLLLMMLPNPWALAAGTVVGGAAAAGTYGMVTGREISLHRRRAELTTEQTSLRESLSEIESMVRMRSAQLPPSTHGQLRMILVGLGEIVERWETLRRTPDQQDAVAATIHRHLPRTLELFLELPDTAKPQHAQEFRDQISVLAEAVARTRDTVVSKDLQALKNNRWLLEESLTDPDERLFRENNL
ncbi:hypothetical protein [Nesterenkonia rhizosphaerae]|uniref:5-bromo-4-chloroindolyl phosphate hydrolysis protein n=1 Tax=Nesterenkonia rhizosphaerae TaxID=1348272 RepID=A0ABP9FXU9_9MICC